jgi:hypothetical protein
MDTTTTDGGAQAQPATPAAVSTGYNADQVITTDASGTPTMAPVTSQSESAETTAPASEAVSEKETQAPAEQTSGLEDISSFAKAKGYDPEALTDGERKALDMARNAEKRMHEVTAAARTAAPAPPEDLPLSGDPNYDAIVSRLNKSEQVQYVTGWFDANPDAKAAKADLQQIAQERPWLQNMDDVYAHYLANPKRESDLRQAGATDALTTLAQKQQQIPPGANATNSGVYETQTITQRNVFDLIDKHDQAWFEKNHEAINKAIAGK